MDGESSVVLLQRVRQGDAEALNALLRRYLPRLKRWAAGRLPRYARDLSDTDDMVQETVIRALRNFEHFEQRGDGALQAYLRQAIVNRIRDELRHSKVKPFAAELPESLQDDAPSPLEAAIGSQTVARYELALSRLDEDDREAIIARLEMGRSYSEIATALDKKSPDAVRMMINRALVKLACYMSNGD